MNRSLVLLSVLFSFACGGGGASDDTTNPDAGKDVTTGADVATKDVVVPQDGSGGNDASKGCGTCPTGYACGSANGLAVCRSQTTQIPLFDHIFVIMMENTSLSTLQDGDQREQGAEPEDVANRLRDREQLSRRRAPELAELHRADLGRNAGHRL